MLTFTLIMSGFLKQKGGYRKLRVYKVTEIIYDLTFYFCEHYLKLGDRTVDQMVQAARSGKQNIAEGSKAAMTSAETEIKLTNVAKSSLEELLLDYEDYLRVRSLCRWSTDHPRFERMRRFVTGEEFEKTYSGLMRRLSDEELANMAITLINQANYMLNRLIERQQELFLANGGVREQMTRARRQARATRSVKSDLSDNSDKSDRSDKSERFDKSE